MARAKFNARCQNDDAARSPVGRPNGISAIKQRDSFSARTLSPAELTSRPLWTASRADAARLERRNIAATIAGRRKVPSQL
jgi:hypothetical protein